MKPLLFFCLVTTFLLGTACSKVDSTPTEADGKKVLESHRSFKDARVISFKKLNAMTQGNIYCMMLTADIQGGREPRIWGSLWFEKTENGWVGKVSSFAGVPEYARCDGF